MKKHILTSLTMFALILSSCSDDEVKKKSKTETPLNAYMENVEAGSVEEYTNGSNYSIGYQFKTKKAGSITELGVAAPQAGTYEVSLYDGTTNELLGTTEVTLTEEQITANPYGFQYSILATAVEAEVDQLFNVVYETNSGAEEFYRPAVMEVDAAPFQMDGSVIEFQEGIYGNLDEAPSNLAGTTFYTADIKFSYK